MSSMVGWSGVFEAGKRPSGIHPLASVGGPPEHRDWMVGDPLLAPQIASSALVHAFCTVDAGMTYRQTTTVGERSFLQARVHLGHNAVVGDDCEICVGVVVCGEVTIGDGVRIGGNSWVKPLVSIGDGAVIGGGSVVTKDVPAHQVWAGNPARFMKNAWTHPAVVGFAGREKVAPQYAMTDEEWKKLRFGVYGQGSSELEQRQRAAKWPSTTDILKYVGVQTYTVPDGEPVASCGPGATPSNYYFRFDAA